MKEEYKIEGMTCAACSSAVERVTQKLDGVTLSSVNLTTARMLIEYDDTKVSPEQIMQKVKKAGFGIEPFVPKEEISAASLKETEEKEQETYHKKKLRLVIAILFACPLLYISMGHMLPFDLPLPEFLSSWAHPLAFALAQLILTIPVLICGSHFYTNGFKTLFKGNPNMDSLVAVGTSAAMIYSVVMTIRISSDPMHVHHLYYESAAVVVTLVMLGKFLESKSKQKTTMAIRKMMELAPDTAILIKDGKESEVMVKELVLGDTIVVKAGMRVPIDGKIIDGASSVDESMLTGESIPVEKTIDDCVIGGSQNINGMLIVSVTSVGQDTTLAKIIHLMEEAQGKKAPISKVADKVAGVFVPVVMVIALIAAIVWLLLGHPLSFALTIFVSVLVIACPCALGLATPTAIMVGTGLGASHGILIKSGESLEISHAVDAVVLDKTGTITQGKPKVTQVVAYSRTKEEIIKIAASVEAGSEHPLAQAIVAAVKEQDRGSLYAIRDFENKTGMGVEAVLKESGERVRIGNAKLYQNAEFEQQQFNNDAKELALKGQTPVYVFIDEEVAGIISIADAIKETSTMAVDKMRSLGIKVYMLTGDNKLAAEEIGKQAHVDEVIAEVLPHEKAEVVKQLQDQGKKVMMVGDGINDAPALIQADVGAAIGSGSDIAIDSADIVLMKSDLMDVYRAIRLSRLTIRNIKQNLFWAFIYNTIGIPVAAGVLYPITGLLLNPMIGGLAMSLSSVCVVTNALRLRYRKLE